MVHFARDHNLGFDDAPRRLAEIERPFRVPAIYLVTPAGALSAVLLMLGLPGDTWLRLGVWLIIGLVIYFLYGMRHSRVAHEAA
jgi:basic amino acid/polyamine antiporter, APA family